MILCNSIEMQGQNGVHEDSEVDFTCIKKLQGLSHEVIEQIRYNLKKWNLIKMDAIQGN